MPDQVDNKYTPGIDKSTNENFDSQNDISLKPWIGKAILLIDLDAFFASVEQLDHPGWRGKPVIVGGDPRKHGVVSTCSYEARTYGVRSAMASSLAHELCPHALWSPGNFSRYREISDKVMSILMDETPYVEQVSIDEAFLDISPTRSNSVHPISIGRRIQKRVDDMGITCSIGLGSTKSVAKIASDLDKPHGFRTVYPGEEQGFLGSLPIRMLSGVGSASAKALSAFGIRTLSDIANADISILKKVFGKNAEMMRSRASGHEISKVEADTEVKSVSHEITFAEDLKTRDEIEAAISTLTAQVARRLRQKHLKGRTLVLRMRYDDRSTRTAQTQLVQPCDDEFVLIPAAYRLIDELWNPSTKIRLLGIGLSGFNCKEPLQETLFDVGFLGEDNQHIDSDSKIADKDKRRDLLQAADAVKDKFGERALRYGHELKNESNTTGTSAKNPVDYK